jgi:hypothetical protein
MKSPFGSSTCWAKMGKANKNTIQLICFYHEWLGFHEKSRNINGESVPSVQSVVIKINVFKE